jgi:hypothetical protein
VLRLANGVFSFHDSADMPDIVTLQSYTVATDLFRNCVERHAITQGLLFRISANSLATLIDVFRDFAQCIKTNIGIVS